jgi:uncharacterized protein YbjT (DUF2867 family)
MILILGATGMFGSRVLSDTAAAGARVRALVHSPSSAPALERAGFEVAIGDLDEPDSVAGAFDGVDTVFMVSPIDDRIAAREGNALAAAERAGARRVVKVYGAVRHDGDPLERVHRASIEAIEASGLSWALVSPNSVMETSLLAQADGVKQADALFGCAGEGRIGMVAADDVARAAVAVLTERDESGVNYEITGPAAVTLAEAAATMGEVLGRPIAYNDMPEQQFRTLLVDVAGVPEEAVDMQVMIHFAAWKRGGADLVTDTYRELTGRAPTSLAEWVAANRAAFEAPASGQQMAASKG